uniref:Bifunctional NADP-dependent methylenetetrahydromethanopterin dehydrogenase/methylenetetrahydrofolate dehydrogenase n=1 Tax=Schlesneria paludicola TaxID=360056 RepID=A0A7C4QJ84_9PLAN
MQRILIQLDTDPLPSSFDRVVAIDAGVEQLFSYGGVTPQNVEPLVHGAMFTRKDLRFTALFIGGSDVTAGEAVLAKVLRTFFGPVRVSVMMDSNGSNTTAAAAVRAVARHLPLADVSAVILGGTGPVGLRAAQLLASQGATVRVASRSLDKAQAACQRLSRSVDAARLSAWETGSSAGLAAAVAGVNVIMGAGAAGAALISEDQWRAATGLCVAIDLNAVPPAGLAGIEPTDKGTERQGVICYGALGIGSAKMKIHAEAVRRLFTANDLVLDTEAIYQIASEIA